MPATPHNTPRTNMASRACPVCGTPLDGYRAGAKYCSTACRREASRVRRLLNGDADGRYGSYKGYEDRKRHRDRAWGSEGRRSRAKRSQGRDG